MTREEIKALRLHEGGWVEVTLPVRVSAIQPESPMLELSTSSRAAVFWCDPDEITAIGSCHSPRVDVTDTEREDEFAKVGRAFAQLKDRDMLMLGEACCENLVRTWSWWRRFKTLFWRRDRSGSEA